MFKVKQVQICSRGRCSKNGFTMTFSQKSYRGKQLFRCQACLEWDIPCFIPLASIIAEGLFCLCIELLNLNSDSE